MARTVRRVPSQACAVRPLRDGQEVHAELRRAERRALTVGRRLLTLNQGTCPTAVLAVEHQVCVGPAPLMQAAQQRPFIAQRLAWGSAVQGGFRPVIGCPVG